VQPAVNRSLSNIVACGIAKKDMEREHSDSISDDGQPSIHPSVAVPKLKIKISTLV